MEDGDKAILNGMNMKYVNGYMVYLKVITLNEITQGYEYKIYKQVLNTTRYSSNTKSPIR